ncbi:MAG TPA: hypothetical protein VF943_07490 [Burkholderiales bacterium]
MERYRKTRIAFALLVTAVLCACSSQPINVAPTPPQKFQRLGAAEGSACGVHLFNIIPISYNSRVEHAYREALTSVPGATGLVNAKLHDDWYFVGIGTMRCARVSAEAIK